MEVQSVVKPAAVVSETTTFAEALHAMDAGQTNTLLVTDEHGKLSGEVTVVDLLGAIIPDTLNGDDVMSHFSDDTAIAAAVALVRDLPVSEFMSRDFTALRPDDNFIAIIANAVAYQRARLPVVDHDNRPVGIISRQGLKRVLEQYLH
jgi:CBS domain-containing protein